MSSGTAEAPTGTTTMRPTTEVPSVARPYSRGGPVFRWAYARWRQMLAFFDLLGADGRPSATKLNAVITSSTIVAIGLVRAWKGAEQAWTWPMFWTEIAILAVLFGRSQFDKYLNVLQSRAGGLGE